jgi:hypothetical protein
VKYIMILINQGEIGERLVPVIFPDFMVHEMVFDAVRPLMPKRSTVSIRSAGEVGLHVRHTIGRSESLGVAANDEDARVINQYDYLNGLI